MDDLSGLVWATELSLDLLGTTFLVRTTSEALGDEVADLMQDFVVAPASGPIRHRFELVDTGPGSGTAIEQVLIHRDGSLLGPPAALGSTLMRMVASLNRDAIEHYEGFAVHSGVVAWGDRAVAFPAGSGGGKSTLTAACLLAGMSYVSDESLSVDPEHETVVPYPKPIALSARSLELLKVRSEALTIPLFGAEGLARAPDLGSHAVTNTTRLAHVVLPRFQSHGVDLEGVSSSEGMAALLRFSFNHYKDGERAFRLTASLASQTRTWRLAYDDPLQAAEVIVNLPR